ncbi:hypothetical protein KKB10_03625 [Patescibacteria group bacterium]|nr:hypothetical protein [Patescibacteria group bacterium]MBU2236201.1 hypothetical protein [Patescibacteria group bacterium]
MKKISWKKLSFAILLVTFGTLGRYLLLDFPNIETMTTTALLAGAMLGGGYALAIPLLSVAVFDIFYGNSSILLFTWSAWAIIGLIGLVLKGRKMKTLKFTASMTGLGMASSLLFYFWTNFGVWLVGSFYPRTVEGLISSYIAGIPFLKMQLIGNLIVVPIATVTLSFVWKGINSFQVKLLKNKPKNADIAR